MINDERASRQPLIRRLRGRLTWVAKLIPSRSTSRLNQHLYVHGLHIVHDIQARGHLVKSKLNITRHALRGGGGGVIVFDERLVKN